MKGLEPQNSLEDLEDLQVLNISLPQGYFESALSCLTAFSNPRAYSVTPFESNFVIFLLVGRTDQKSTAWLGTCS